MVKQRSQMKLSHSVTDSTALQTEWTILHSEHKQHLRFNRISYFEEIF